MIPFSLHCTTCKAALRVTNRAAIGQILPCPKCGSMVQVVPPAEVEAASPAVTGAAAATPAIEAAGSATPLHAANHIDAIAAAALVDSPRQKCPPPLPESAAAGAPLHDIATSTVFSGVPWVPIAAGVAAVAILAAGAWLYLGNAGAASIVAEASLEPAVAIESPVGAVDRNATGESPERGDVAAAESEPAGQESPADQKLDQSSDSPVPSPNQTLMDDALANGSEALDAAASLQVEATVREADNASQSASSDELSVSQPAGPSDAPPPESGQRLARKPSLVLQDLPETLLQTANTAAVLTTGKEEPNELPDPGVQAGGAGEVLPDVAAQAAEAPLRRIPPAKVDVPARLATKVAAIEFRDAPLHRALATISDLAGVTISLDIDALYAAGIGIGEPVTVSGTSLTVAAVLEQAIDSVGLTAREEQGQLRVGPIRAGQPRSARYAIDDLVRSSDPPIEELAGIVGALMDQRDRRASSPNRKETGLSVADGAILLSAAEIDHDRMIELCEKLRVARGRPLRSRFSAERPDARFDPRRFELATRRARAQAVLARRITAGVGRPAPLCDVVAYLAEQTNSTILFDGPALAAAGLAVETEARLVAVDESLEAALGRLLQPLGLDYRVVDDQVIEISTLQAIAQRPCIEFYPVRGQFHDETPAVGDFAAYREKLLAAAGIEGRSAVVVFDPPSQCLIVSAAYPEQVRLERALKADAQSAGRRGNR